MQKNWYHSWYHPFVTKYQYQYWYRTLPWCSISISIGIEFLALNGISISIGIELLSTGSISIVSVSKKVVSKVSALGSHLFGMGSFVTFDPATYEAIGNKHAVSDSVFKVTRII